MRWIVVYMHISFSPVCSYTAKHRCFSRSVQTNFTALKHICHPTQGSVAETEDVLAVLRVQHEIETLTASRTSL